MFRLWATKFVKFDPRERGRAFNLLVGFSRRPGQPVAPGGPAAFWNFMARPENVLNFEFQMMAKRKAQRTMFSVLTGHAQSQSQALAKALAGSSHGNPIVQNYLRCFFQKTGEVIHTLNGTILPKFHSILLQSHETPKSMSP